MNPKAIIFDWDDTLVDNWHSIHTALNATLKAMGQEPWSYEKTQSNVRRSMRDSFPSLFGERWTEAADLFLSHVKSHHLETIIILDKVPKMLRKLHTEGFYLGVASNKNGNLLREEAEFLNWSMWFSKIIGANDAVRDKPDRAPIDMVLEGSGIRTGKDVWFVGDALSDMECAHNAGVVAVLKCNKVYDYEKFAKFPPHIRFKNADELSNFLT